jgi:HsdR family type I site-specific deoxyribonuclease
VSRYQQLRVANKIVDRVMNTNLDQGIAWHTQGSGKSLSMLFTAYKLRANPELGDPTVYIVVDRKDLKTQIGETFEDCLFPNTTKPLTIGQLREKITNRPAEVIITTIQKFQEMNFGPNGNVTPDDREKVIILIDEAHRTQYGQFHSVLKAAFPNARRFAFTGTPIPKTQEEFGAVKDGKVEAYLDRYSIDDAIKDEATKPVRYAFGPTELLLDKEKLKAGYQEITKELNEEEKQKVEKKVQPWKEFLKTDTRIKALVKHKNDANANIEQILLDLEKLYIDVDEVGNLPHRMGFADRGRYDLFLDIKHAVGAAFDETQARQFVDVLVGGLVKGLYAGWQESELRCNDIVTDIKTLGDDDDFASLGISDNVNLVETLLKRLIQDYSIA